MGFSENLEGDLKNLESAAERDPAEVARRQASRAAERAAALAIRPHAEQLRKSAFTAALLDQAVVIGHSMRVAVRIAWIGASLRLQARDHYLELRPTPDGVRAYSVRGDRELEVWPVDFSSSAEALARHWLESVSSSTPSSG